MDLYAVLDATHYPVAIFKSLNGANAYAASRPHCYVVRTCLVDALVDADLGDDPLGDWHGRNE